MSEHEIILAAISDLRTDIAMLRVDLSRPAVSITPVGIDRVITITGLSKSTVMHHLEKTAGDGGIPCTKRLGKLFFLEADLLAWIAAGKRTTSTTEASERMKKHKQRRTPHATRHTLAQQREA